MRELVVLGTASQAPTRTRNHNALVLYWDDEAILFDPGEGTQRQMLLAGVRSSQIARICITHFHGDHCLGLPGVVQRMSLDEVPGPVELCYPASGERYVQRLLHASVFDERTAVAGRPVHEPGPVATAPSYLLSAERLDHEPETFGWRLEEPDGRTMVPELLAAAELSGPEVGELQRTGSLSRPGRPVVRLEDVSVVRHGQVAAVVMDTGLCDAAFALAEGADLLVCESTFSDADRDLAARFHHLTAVQAARIAAESGVRRLVLTHFSQRYPDEQVLLAEAKEVFDDVVAARDLVRVPVPPRRVVASGEEHGLNPGRARGPQG